MKLIAIDTCLDACQVAVVRPGVSAVVRAEAMARGHQERLATLAAEAMVAAGLAFAELERVAVTVGPGSFTGLRVGLAFAKGLALALDIPCVGIGVLEALAASVDHRGFVAACVDAKRGQVYLQAFSDGRAIMAPDALDPDLAAARLAELWPGPPGVLVGSGARELAPVLPGVGVIDLAAPSAEAVARLGLAAREPIPPPRPLYLRAPDAKLPQPRGGV